APAEAAAVPRRGDYSLARRWRRQGRSSGPASRRRRFGERAALREGRLCAGGSDALGAPVELQSASRRVPRPIRCSSPLTKEHPDALLSVVEIAAVVGSL